MAGGSLGGNQALQWTVAYPEMVAGCVAIATCASLSAQGIAWNEIGRQAITSDPAWNGGDYYGGPQPERGLAVARMIGHVTYLSEQSMMARFGAPAARARPAPDDVRRGAPARLPATATHGDARVGPFEVESYLRHQGQRFVDRFDANSYLAISRAIDEFDLAEAFGERLAGARVRAGRGELPGALVQLGLAVSAARVAADRGGAGGGRPRGDVPEPALELRPRRLPAGGGPPDEPDPAVPGPPPRAHGELSAGRSPTSRARGPVR